MAVAANPRSHGWTANIRTLEEAYLVHPNYPFILTANSFYLLETGYFSEALSVTEHWVSIDPLSSQAQWFHAQALWATGQGTEADAAMQRSLDWGEPYAALALFGSHILSNNFEAAIPVYEAFLEMTGRDPARASAWLTQAVKPATGRQFLLETREKQDFESLSMVFFFLVFGYLDDFYDGLDERLNPDTFWNDGDDVLQMAIAQRHAGVTTHPRYLPLMEAMGIVALWDERGAPDHCSKESGAWVCQ